MEWHGVGRFKIGKQLNYNELVKMISSCAQCRMLLLGQDRCLLVGSFGTAGRNYLGTFITVILSIKCIYYYSY